MEQGMMVEMAMAQTTEQQQEKRIEAANQSHPQDPDGFMPPQYKEDWTETLRRVLIGITNSVFGDNNFAKAPFLFMLGPPFTLCVFFFTTSWARSTSYTTLCYWWPHSSRCRRCSCTCWAFSCSGWSSSLCCTWTLWTGTTLLTSRISPLSLPLALRSPRPTPCSTSWSWTPPWFLKSGGTRGFSFFTLLLRLLLRLLSSLLFRWQMGILAGFSSLFGVV